MLPGQSYDLIIVGGGIVGTTLAVALKDTGLKIAIIEEKTLEAVADRKQAYALSIVSGRIFQGLGVWAKIFPHIGKFDRIRLSDGNYPVFVPFVTEELKTDYLGYVGEHGVIVRALQSATEDRDNIHWLCPARVGSIEYGRDGATLSLEMAGKSFKIDTKLIIGADGARSAVREGAGIKTRGWKYWQSCVALTVKHKLPENNTAFERFWSTGPMGILPLPDNRCQIVWTNPHARAKELKEMPEKDFIALLEEYTGLGELELVGDRNLFPVQLMQSDNYIKPRLALIGDAAHCCHPVGGQGLNLGIRDAAALAQILSEATARGEDIGSIEVLRNYEKWRKKENLTILGFTDFLDRFFSNNFLPAVGVRRLGLVVMRYIRPVKLFALQLMTGLLGKIPEVGRLSTN